MQTQIYAPFDELPPRFRRHAESRIRTTLGRWKHRLARVRVFLRDENGPRGGADKSCRLVLETHRGRSIVVRSDADDPRTALGDALKRARRRIARVEDRLASGARSRRQRRPTPEAA